MRRWRAKATNQPKAPYKTAMAQPAKAPPASNDAAPVAISATASVYTTPLPETKPATRRATTRLIRTRS